MSFVMRRSLPSMAGLVGLLLLVGYAVVVFAGGPIWFPVVFAVGLLLLQYLVNPFIVEWLVPAELVARTDDGYATDHPVGAIVARRCRDAGVPLVKLGIVDDGTPNAFTFGRTPKDARMWVTRGLLERLDERELDAVVAHEVGHVKHWDFAVMTIAAVVPMVLYLVFLVTRTSDRQGKLVAVGAYIAYLVSYFTLLALSRAREYAADRWSCVCTGDGDALASALVKIAYGMGQALAEEKTKAEAAVADAKRRQAAARNRGSFRARSMNVMGIFDQREAEAMAAAFAAGIDPQRAVAAMRWDLVNPWGRTLEKLSSHPLVAHRIAALEEAPGGPKVLNVLRATVGVSAEGRGALRRAWAYELLVAIVPWAILVLAVLGGVARSVFAVGLALAAAGAFF